MSAEPIKIQVSVYVERAVFTLSRRPWGMIYFEEENIGARLLVKRWPHLIAETVWGVGLSRIHDLLTTKAQLEIAREIERDLAAMFGEVIVRIGNE